MCACYGVEPTEALAQSRGGYRCQTDVIKEAVKAQKHIIGRKKPFHKVGKLCQSTHNRRKRGSM